VGVNDSLIVRSYINPTMQNNISLQPNPVVASYLKHFQIAQRNLNLFLKEEKPVKRKRKFKSQLNKEL
jgi:hypothetical protein